MRKNTLTDLRKEIDEVDELLVELLTRRDEIVKRIGKYKKENSLKILDKERFTELLKQRTKLAKKHTLSEKFVNKLFNLLHEHALEIEDKV